MNDVHSLAGAYALDAVDDAERAAFDRHLAGCASCRLEVAELRETVGRLAAATADDPGARALRGRVLDEVARTPQERLPGRPRRAPAGGWRRLVAAAAVACALAGGAGAVTWTVAENRVEQERAAGAEARQVADVLAAPDARVASSALEGGGVATVVTSAAQDRAVVLLRDLPAPGGERAYQLWLVRGAEPARSVGLLAAGATAATTLIGPLGGAAVFGLSEEPAGGSPSPTEVVGLLPLT
jgi:anti-sigma-K factor RskA